MPWVYEQGVRVWRDNVRAPRRDRHGALVDAVCDVFDPATPHPYRPYWAPTTETAATPPAWTEGTVTWTTATNASTTSATPLEWIVRAYGQGWTNAYTQQALQRWTQPIVNAMRVQPEEERALLEQYQRERERDADAYAERIRAERAEHQRANTRAEALLIEHLSPQQAEELRLRGHFHVRLLSGRRYRIRRGQHGNVCEVDGRGQAIRSLCVQPVGYLPDADAMLAQKLWLETDEAALLRTANITPLRQPERHENTVALAP